MDAQEDHTVDGGGKIDAKIPVLADGDCDWFEPKRSAANDEGELNCLRVSMGFGFGLTLPLSPTNDQNIYN